MKLYSPSSLLGEAAEDGIMFYGTGPFSMSNDTDSQIGGVLAAVELV